MTRLSGSEDSGATLAAIHRRSSDMTSITSTSSTSSIPTTTDDRALPPTSVGTTGISDEHVALHDTVRRWAASRCDRAAVRAALEADAEELPSFWDELGEQGWLGLHLPEAFGGEGFGLAETAIVVEELARVCTPGPYLSTVLASAAIARGGSDEQRERWLPGLADGTSVAAFGTRGAPAMGAALADVLVLSTPGGWVVLSRDEVEVTPRPSLDPTRRVASVALRHEPDAAARLTEAAGTVVGALVAADAVGVMSWCVTTAADHAKARVQFGRPIGQFQAVKHRCADMLLQLELARAAAWDASRGGDPREADLAADVALATSVDAAFQVAKDCIQVLGGIGYTWEHDAHLYLKRATAMHQLFPTRPVLARIGELALAGARRTHTVELPPDADAHRREVQTFLGDLKATPKAEWNTLMADHGYLAPYWPKPWGRDAGPVEQLVIDEEFAAARVRRPHLQVGAWVLPTIIAHGTREQQDRWVGPTLRGEIVWCQMFSEPGAGSDLAALSTRATRVEGGWSLTGQKVWTTMAHLAHWGICLARTDPDVDKHDGITCFLVDMRSEGLDIRPLRELTGQALFNEVFLDQVFVPDDCVVGAVNDGWRAARTTLANERVSMGGGSSFGPGVEAVLAADPETVRAHLVEMGALVAEGQAIAVMGLRSTIRSLTRAEPGPESSVRKLVGVEHEQRVQEMGLLLLGAEAAATDGEAATWVAGFLGNRALSIAGGTSDVQRNIIAERLLGLPKDA
jgi:3-oxochol-4-en-24-oyl-CoA dehydrogenase